VRSERRGGERENNNDMAIKYLHYVVILDVSSIKIEKFFLCTTAMCV